MAILQKSFNYVNGQIKKPKNIDHKLVFLDLLIKQINQSQEGLNYNCSLDASYTI